MPFEDFSFSVAADGSSIVAIAGGPLQARAR